MNEGRLKNKVAIVIGASGDAGGVIVRRMHEEGMSGFSLTYSSNEAKVRELAKNLKLEPLIMQVDFTGPNAEKEAKEVVRETVKKYGKVDVLVNNSGVWAPKPFLEETEEEWDSTMAINVKGARAFMKAVIPQMMQHGGGSIINISSIAAKFGAGYQAAYSASKGALESLTRSLADEFARFLIRINAIAPSLMDTQAVRKYMSAETIARYIQHTPMKRLVTPEDIAEAVVFLASDESKNITGQTLVIDAGMRMIGLSVPLSANGG